jgi:epoxyqueuosine reductase QueG
MLSRHIEREVCPWNGGKFMQITGEPGFNGRDRNRKRKRLRERAGTWTELPGTSLTWLILLMRMTHGEWDEWTRRSAMRRGMRGSGAMWRVRSGNWGSEEAVPVLVEALSDPEPLVRSHSAWAPGFHAGYWGRT